ncbi:hypothetical protein SBF1_3350002 [Candidatus Desulfosporosinus infrequens]|uniref:Uncharacterized protein n=1 Tax=Candidatus Desulfosporosinus infrequens TaxID=2043169 RepID=A0A2U3L169_9FIRM|nr:hypothetical protein SBF1_3350002 [Candidatus Desulfosporosinus infrequens]
MTYCKNNLSPSRKVPKEQSMVAGQGFYAFRVYLEMGMLSLLRRRWQDGNDFAF